jgi:hypothetical protein
LKPTVILTAALLCVLSPISFAKPLKVFILAICRVRMSKVHAPLLAAIPLMVSGAVAGEIWVSPSGDDSSKGSKDQPFKTFERVAKAVRETSSGSKDEGVTVWFRGGRYPVGQTAQIDSKVSGPILFRAVEGEVPVLDSGLPLDLSAAKLVSDADTSGRLAPGAMGKVHRLEVKDKAQQKALANTSVRMSLDGRMMTLAKYPNIGFGHIGKITAKGAVYAEGRTQGPPPKWSLVDPIGASFSLRDKDVSPWAREIASANKLRITGYFAYDWYGESHPVASIANGEIRLADSSRYGVGGGEKIPRRIRAVNLLCELDAPGEFYFDDKESALFFIPPAELKPGSVLSVWGGPGPFKFVNASKISLEGLVIEGVGTGLAAVEIKDSRMIRMQGCTIRNCSRPAVVISGGEDNGLAACDIYDVPHHLTLDGGDVPKLIPSGHFAINCHFTQVAASDFYGKIRIAGVGQRFRNNLIHNFPGQVMDYGGCDHEIVNNELFNIGFEEGDGGAIYAGASLWSWGNVLRNNFLHHLMCLPQAHPRGGIYPDDLDQGETIQENVFFKAAHRAVLINGGAGHKVADNLFLQGHIGIYNTESFAERCHAFIARYDSGELKRGDKDDRIWRTEQVVGPGGWNKEPWASRFPLFRKIMNQEKMRFYPIECEFTGNRFAGNWRDIEYRTGSKPDAIKEIGEVSFIRSGDNRGISMEIFQDPGALDFSYKSLDAARDMPKIDFGAIGLQLEGLRRAVPAKESYRKAVRERFENRKSFDTAARYDPKTINDQVYFNSGRLLLENGGMIHD